MPPATTRAPREIATPLVLEIATPLAQEKATHPKVATPPLASSPTHSGLWTPINHVINQTCKTRKLSVPPMTTREIWEVAAPLAPAVAAALAFGIYLVGGGVATIPLSQPCEEHEQADEEDEVYGIVMSIEELRDLPDDAGFVMVPFRIWQQLEREQSLSQSVDQLLCPDAQPQHQVELERPTAAESLQTVDESSEQLAHPQPHPPHPHSPIEPSTIAATCATGTPALSSPLSRIASSSTSSDPTNLRLKGGGHMASLLPPKQPPAEAPPPEPPPPLQCRCGFVMRSQSGEDLRSRHQLGCGACPADERDAAWASYEAAWRACNLTQRDASYDNFSAAHSAYTAASDPVPWGAPYECGRCGYSCGFEDNWSRHVGRCEEAFNIGYRGAPPGLPTPSTYLAHPLPDPLPQAEPTSSSSYLAPVPNSKPQRRTPPPLTVPSSPAKTTPPPAKKATLMPPAPPRTLTPTPPRLHLREDASLMSAAAKRRVMRPAPSERQVPPPRVAPGPLHRRSRRGQRSRRCGRRRRMDARGQEGRPGVPRCRARYGEGSGRSRSGPTSIHWRAEVPVPLQ